MHGMTFWNFRVFRKYHERILWFVYQLVSVFWCQFFKEDLMLIDAFTSTAAQEIQWQVYSFLKVFLKALLTFLRYSKIVYNFII